MHQQLVQASRVLMGDSLGFHIIFLMFGLTLPILAVWFEYLGYKRRDERLVDLAKLWSKLMTVTIIAGVVSGTIIALQMSLVWPGIIKFGGQVIGLPFLFESYAFIIEAVFVALYMYTWNKHSISRKLHLLFGFFIILGGTLSAYSITSVNAFMNLPTGFTLVKGKFTNIEVWKALFSRTTIIEFTHSMLGYYLAIIMVMAAIYGYKLYKQSLTDRKAKNNINKIVVVNMLLAAALIMILSIITGDLSGKYLAEYEPVKLAQIEALTKTGPHAPLIIGGILNDKGVLVGPHFKIPNALSILVGGSSNTNVKGLDIYAVNQRPPAYIHSLFDIKMSLVGLLSAVIFGILILKIKFVNILSNRIILMALTIIGFSGLIIVELGWMITEIGRQPWAVRGYLYTTDAFNNNTSIKTFGYIFPTLFVILSIVTIVALKRVSKAHTER